MERRGDPTTSRWNDKEDDKTDTRGGIANENQSKYTCFFLIILVSYIL